MKFMNKFQKFMCDRYGPDELYFFLFKVYLLLFVINIFLNSNILTYLELLIVVYMFYRFLSKKIHKRNKENIAYIKLKNQLLKPFNNIKRNFSDKYHVYKKCRKCKTTLKLPLPCERGIKVAKCPTCGNKVKMLVLKKLDVEIIRN